MNDVKDSIGWADYTWNPVVGCKRGCKYCYAKRNYDRLHKKRLGGRPFSDIQFFPSRLEDPDLYHKPASKIFVGSMSDPEYWPAQLFKEIFQTCTYYHAHTYMFLTKNPHSYSGLIHPINCMLGTTFTGAELNTHHLLSHAACYRRPFLSIEPLLWFIPAYNYDCFEKIIVGAMTGPGAIAPKQEWIQSIKDNIPAEKLYWKKNIQRYL